MAVTRSPLPLFFRLRAVAAPPLVPILVAVALLVPLAGCLTTNVRSQEGTGDTAALRVRVFTNPDAVEQGRADGAGTLVELFRLRDGGQESFVHRSLAAEWGIDGLPPGEYRVKVRAVLDAQGNIRDPRSGDRVTDFEVEVGKTADVAIILRETPTGLIIVAAITVVLLLVAVAVLLEDVDDFPLPHELLENLPPPPMLPHVMMWGDLYVEFPIGGASFSSAPSRPPRVTSVFPDPGSIVAARRIAPALTVSQSISLAGIGPSTIRMLGTKSGLVRGATSVEQGILRFVPAQDLVPGEAITVTVLGEDVENSAGQELDEDFSWSFVMAE